MPGDHRRRPRSPTPRRSIPATASCRRTPTSPSIVEEHGITFIGPTAEHIRIDGRQDRGQAHGAGALGLPLVPGSDGGGRRRPRRPSAIAEAIGYPVIIKAAAGGGGRGMKVVRQPRPSC